MEVQFYRKTDKTDLLIKIQNLTVLNLLMIFLGTPAQLRSEDGLGVPTERWENNSDFISRETRSEMPQICESKNRTEFHADFIQKNFHSSIEKQYAHLYQVRSKPKEPSQAPLPSDIKPLKHTCPHCRRETGSTATTQPATHIETQVEEEPQACKMTFFQKGVQQIKRLGERMKF